MLDESTDLITIPTKADVPALFAKEGAIDALVSRIEEEARSVVQDYSNDKGRKAAKTLAAKVSRSKTLIDEVGKALNDERNALNKAVNTTRNMAKERLDALRDEIKQPALEAEAKEADRVRAHLVAMDQFEKIELTSQNTSGELQAQIDMTEAVDVGEAWEEYEADARAAKAAALEKLKADQVIAVARENQEAELEALRLEKAHREEADRAAKSSEEAKAIADAAEKAEAERDKQTELDKAEAVKVAAKEAEQKAVADTEAAEARHKSELDEAKAREERAAQAERDRLAQERRDSEAAENRRKADAEHRRRIRSEIVVAITKMKPANWEECVDAMIAGEIPHLKVLF
jgi:hypothetical protein